MHNLESYLGIVGDETIARIHRRARALYDKHILHINSSFQGGGVAEILSSLVPLMNDAGLDAGWRILHGNPDFFGVTKKFHNALQGGAMNFTEMKKRVYLQTNRDFSIYSHFNHDCLVVHDPQPLPLINFFKKNQPWVWRCHIDLSSPHPQLWAFLKTFILRYDLVIVSSEDYKKADLPVEQRVIAPAIDPLSAKNMPLTPDTIAKALKKNGIPTDKPIITQISRFDKWKNPEGVVEMFKIIRREADVRLVLCGSMAMDDPEGFRIYERVRQKTRALIESGDVILPTTENQILVNALQRSSAVVVQASLREGFGLTVTEAMLKGRPVVASRIGGIPLQIEDGVDGFLVEPEDIPGFASRILEILRLPDGGKEIGENAREKVRKKFLITRLLLDYLDLMNELLA